MAKGASRRDFDANSHQHSSVSNGVETRLDLDIANMSGDAARR